MSEVIDNSYEIGDVVRTADGEAITVTVTSSVSMRFTWERGWEISFNDGPWEPYLGG